MFYTLEIWSASKPRKLVGTVSISDSTPPLGAFMVFPYETKNKGIRELKLPIATMNDGFSLYEVLIANKEAIRRLSYLPRFKLCLEPNKQNERKNHEETSRRN